MLRALPAVLLALLLAACDVADQQRSFRERALAVPSGYTRTDAEGNVIGAADPDDWQVAPIYGPASQVSVTITRPLYPNPSPADRLVTLFVNVTGGAVVGGLRVVGYLERPGQLPQAYPLAVVPNATGFQAIEFAPAIEPAFAQGGGLRRIVVFDGQGEPVTYGDLLIE